MFFEVVLMGVGNYWVNIVLRRVEENCGKFFLMVIGRNRDFLLCFILRLV